MKRSVKMGIKFISDLPSEKELKEKYPLSESLRAFKEKRDIELKDIFAGKDKRFIIITGPCSADDPKAIDIYIERLSKLSKKVSDKIFIIPRIYTVKPRTKSKGYKGLLHQPDALKAENIKEGIEIIRRIHLNVLEHGLSSADELLYTEVFPYVEDLLSYVVVGARSVESQHCRFFASALDQPVGMKNPLSGDLSVLMNSVLWAEDSHRFIFKGKEVESTGNPYAHGILRGITMYESSSPNYHYRDIEYIYNLYKKALVKYPSIIVDCSHGNSNKDEKKQCDVAMEVLDIRRKNLDFKKIIKGIMLESYLMEGHKALGDEGFGKSITDPCLSFEQTEKLINKIYKML